MLSYNDFLNITHVAWGILVDYNTIRLELVVEQEVLRQKKLSIFVLIFIFIVLYVIIIGFFLWANKYINLGVGNLVAQIIFLYIYLMFVMRTQLLYYEYTLIEDSLIIKEYLSKREKTLLIIPIDNILTINKEQQHNNSFFNKRRKIIKKNIKNTELFYIEYDDYADISLLKLQCSKSFIDKVCKYI